MSRTRFSVTPYRTDEINRNNQRSRFYNGRNTNTNVFCDTATDDKIVSIKFRLVAETDNTTAIHVVYVFVIRCGSESQSA